jgi:peroxiredoxin
MLAAALLLAGPPRFLGPPEKKPADPDAPALAPGSVAPAFSAPVVNADVAGQRTFDLAAGQVVLLSFFDAACAACKTELAVLEELYTQYRRRGLSVVSAAPDPAALLGHRRVSYPVIADKDSALARAYLGARPSFPAAVVIGKDGKVVAAKPGYRGDPAVLLRAEVESALR